MAFTTISSFSDADDPDFTGPIDMDLDEDRDLLFVYCGSADFIFVLDVDSNRNLSFRNKFSFSPGNRVWIEYSETHQALFAVHYQNGEMFAIDCADPDNLSQVDVTGVSEEGPFYLEEQNDLAIAPSPSPVDISDPANMVTETNLGGDESVYGLEPGWSVSASGALSDIRSHDHSVPTNVQFAVGEISNTTWTKIIATHKGYLYAVDGDFFRVFDFTDPANPNHPGYPDVSTSPDPNAADAREVVDDILAVGTDDGVELYIVNDPANITQRATWVDSTAVKNDVGIDRFAYFYKAVSAENTVYVGSEEDTTVKAPDKPTLFVDSVADQGASLSSSAYSHPQNVDHQDSKWQVRLATASDWTSPEYDSGWTSQDLESHDASPLPSSESLEARVIHRDINGTQSASDPKSFSTTGQLEASRGPEGFLFGQSGGNNLYKFGERFLDGDTSIIARLVTNAIAPGGGMADHLFTNLYLTLAYETGIEVTVSPVIDGTLVTDAVTTFTRAYGGDELRDTVEVALTKTHDRGSGALSRQHLRGTWIEVIVEIEDVFGSGGYAMVEGAELEYEILQESKAAAGG